VWMMLLLGAMPAALFSQSQRDDELLDAPTFPVLPAPLSDVLLLAAVAWQLYSAVAFALLTP
jgi:hypothetical protein